MGCYSDPNIQTDGVQQHAVSSTFADSATLTQASCALSCEKLGFGYAAVEVSWLLLRRRRRSEERRRKGEGENRVWRKQGMQSSSLSAAEAGQPT
jgi:hypothetical protein